MESIGSIARRALDRVQQKIADAIQDGILLEPVKTGYDHATGAYVTDLTERATGRVVTETTRPVKSVFPDFVAGPGDQLMLLEGFAVAPQTGWTLRLGRDHEILRVQDILGAGTLFFAVVR
jgi:hypothetical protein